MVKLFVAVFILFVITAEAQEFLINELMISNSSTLFDEDGDTPDWIELYNKSSNPVNLAGYTLSDNPQNLQKWFFPEITLQPENHLLIFASGKNRLNSVYEWETVIDWGDSCNYLPLESEPDADWRMPGFDDSSWQRGVTGVGYGDGDDNTVIDPVITVASRQKFSIKNTTQVEKLILHMDYDDSFVAYINGVEVARSNIGTVGIPPDYDQHSDEYIEAVLYTGGDPAVFDISDLSILENGENVLAIEVHNFGINSSDLTLIPFLSIGYNSGQDSSRGTNPLLTFPNVQLHTNFKLSSGGEPLFLVSPGLEIQDSIGPIIIPRDYSYGRKPDGGIDWLFFSESSPGEENSFPGFLGFGDTVKITPQAGFYETAVTVDLSIGGGSSRIYYTLDGSDPDSFSTFYESPINITNSTVVRAIGYQDGVLPGPVNDQTFFVDEPTDLPVISLITDPDNLWDSQTGIYADGPNASPSFPHFGANFWQDWERPAKIEFFESDKSTAFESGCGIKIFGGWSRGHAQKSLSVFFRGEYGSKSLDYDLFPDINIDRFESFVLRNAGNDWDGSMMRDGLMQTLLNDLDIDKLGFRPAVVFINGEYWGIHHIREKINEHFIASHHPVDANNIDMLENDGIAIHGDSQHYNELLDFLNTNDLSTAASYKFIKQQVDLNEYIDYMVAQIYFDNTDWPGNNIKYWRPKTEGGKWRWILYDTDFGFSRFNSQAYKNNTLSLALEENGPDWPNPPWSTFLLRKFLENDSIKTKFINRIADLLNSTFRKDQVKTVIDSVDTIISNEIVRHLGRWSLNQGNRNNHLNYINAFADSREAYFRSFVLQQFGLQGSTLIKLNSSTGGQIKINRLIVDQFPWQGHYFKDVSIQIEAIAKPGFSFNGWTGSITSEARLITIKLGSNIDLVADFTVDESNHGVVINEINYNSVNNFDSGDWVEFYNSSDQNYDISGWVFKDSDDSHEYKFADQTVIAPKSFLVLAENDSAFSSLFPGIAHASPMNFGLSSNGELVRLYDGQNKIVDSLVYDEKLPWPEQANGSGATLELKNPAFDNSLAKNWWASAGHGSPGAQNTVYTSLDEQKIFNSKFSLEQNYPNPFNPETVISYHVKENNNRLIHVKLEIYNALGQKVKTLVNSFQEAGHYKINFNAKEIGAGLYFYKIKSGAFVETKKMLFLP